MVHIYRSARREPRISRYTRPHIVSSTVSYFYILFYLANDKITLLDVHATLINTASGQTLTIKHAAAEFLAIVTHTVGHMY